MRTDAERRAVVEMEKGGALLEPSSTNWSNSHEEHLGSRAASGLDDAGDRRGSTRGNGRPGLEPREAILGAGRIRQRRRMWPAPWVVRRQDQTDAATRRRGDLGH